ncbi:unnamed protein product [Amaranthus hypochondriacus]
MMKKPEIIVISLMLLLLVIFPIGSSTICTDEYTVIKDPPGCERDECLKLCESQTSRYIKLLGSRCIYSTGACECTGICSI